MRVNRIIGSATKMKPIRAQFSEYALSLKARYTKYAENIEQTHQRKLRTTKYFVFFWDKPRISRMILRITNMKEIG